MYTPVPKGYYETDHWKRKRLEALRHYGWTCQACGQKGGRLDVHHTPEAYQKLWREPVHLLKPLCHRKCHPKGRYSAWEIRRDRGSYRWLRVLEWVPFLPFRMLRWLWRTALSEPKID